MKSRSTFAKLRVLLAAAAFVGFTAWLFLWTVTSVFSAQCVDCSTGSMPSAAVTERNALYFARLHGRVVTDGPENDNGHDDNAINHPQQQTQNVAGVAASKTPTSGTVDPQNDGTRSRGGAPAVTAKKLPSEDGEVYPKPDSARPMKCDRTRCRRDQNLTLYCWGFNDASLPDPFDHPSFRTPSRKAAQEEWLPALKRPLQTDACPPRYTRVQQRHLLRNFYTHRPALVIYRLSLKHTANNSGGGIGARQIELDNVQFFLKHGLLPNGRPTALFNRVDYVFVTSNGKSDLHLHAPLDCLRRSNVRVISVPPSVASCESCALSHVMSHLGGPRQLESKYEQVVMLSSAVRGPFWSEGAAADDSVVRGIRHRHSSNRTVDDDDRRIRSLLQHTQAQWIDHMALGGELMYTHRVAVTTALRSVNGRPALGTNGLAVPSVALPNVARALKATCERSRVSTTPASSAPSSPSSSPSGPACPPGTVEVLSSSSSKSDPITSTCRVVDGHITTADAAPEAEHLDNYTREEVALRRYHRMLRQELQVGADHESYWNTTLGNSSMNPARATVDGDLLASLMSARGPEMSPTWRMWPYTAIFVPAKGPALQKKNMTSIAHGPPDAFTDDGAVPAVGSGRKLMRARIRFSSFFASKAKLPSVTTSKATTSKATTPLRKPVSNHQTSPHSDGHFPFLWGWNYRWSGGGHGHVRVRYHHHGSSHAHANVTDGQRELPPLVPVQLPRACVARCNSTEALAPITERYHEVNGGAKIPAAHLTLLRREDLFPVDLSWGMDHSEAEYFPPAPLPPAPAVVNATPVQQVPVVVMSDKATDKAAASVRKSSTAGQRLNESVTLPHTPPLPRNELSGPALTQATVTEMHDTLQQSPMSTVAHLPPAVYTNAPLSPALQHYVTDPSLSTGTYLRSLAHSRTIGSVGQAQVVLQRAQIAGQKALDVDPCEALFVDYSDGAHLSERTAEAVEALLSQPEPLFREEGCAHTAPTLTELLSCGRD